VLAAPHNASITVAAGSLIPCLLVEYPKRLHYIVKADGSFASGHAPQSGSCLDRTRVRRPRRKNRALFIQGEAGIVDNVRRMFERLCGVQKVVKIEGIVAV